MAPSFFIFIALLYIALLFAIALRGDRKPLARRWQPWVYGLSLAVYCTSWTFYGATRQFGESGWAFAPSHVGAILLFVFGFTFWLKLVRVAKRENVTTIADFIASRFGHSRAVAVSVALISLIGIVPYVALQLKAVSVSLNIVSGDLASSAHWYTDSALYVSLMMALFTMLFGTRHLDTSEHHPGMMLAIAFESVVKLIAFLAVGYWAVYSVGGGFGQIIRDTMANPETRELLTSFDDPYVYLTQAALGIVAIVALPRQFHVAVVENRNEDDLRKARWIFPLYLVAINFFTLPLVLVGFHHFAPDAASLEYLTLTLPMAEGQNGLALFTFVGGLSAATSMVIIATVALSTMLSNEIILPALIRLGWWSTDAPDLGRRIVWLRRLGILLIVLAAFFYYRLIVAYEGLVAIGLVSFVAVAQFAPALFLGLFWTAINRSGVLWGLGLGFLFWCYTLLMPLFVRAGLMPEHLLDGLFGLSFLKPQALMGLGGLDPIVHGAAWSLAMNVLGLLLGSAYTRETLKDRMQASLFVHANRPDAPVMGTSGRQVSVGDLHLLLGRFIGAEKLQVLFARYINPLNGRLLGDQKADDELLYQAERALSSVLGAPAARLLFERFDQPMSGEWRDLSTMVDEASQVLKFNRELLNSALQSINQGISIVDRDLNVVAWNQEYQQMFDYPDGLLAVGRPVEELIRYNALKGECGPGEVEDLVQRRLNHLRSGGSYRYERRRPDGSYLEIQGNPMPDGGFITVYSDITDRRRIEDQLRRSNEILEDKVQQRTQALQMTNTELEKANANKTRFLAAAGHDLVQPLNSAALFAASMQSKLRRFGDSGDLVNLAEQIERSLNSADNLLSELLEISKLDSDIIKPEIQRISLDKLLNSLHEEFEVLAAKRGIRLTIVPSSLWVESDPRLLRRMLQNFLSNALRYSQRGRVALGVRRHGDYCSIEVWDTGPGLNDAQQNEIFEEFHRLPDTRSDEKGLGLGLAIVRRLSRLLKHPVSISSTLGRGSGFRVHVPVTQAVTAQNDPQLVDEANSRVYRILCVDNEQQIIEGMHSLLAEWGFQVDTAADKDGAEACVARAMPDLIIMDYHLDQGLTGLSLLKEWQQTWLRHTPVIVITADYTDEVRLAIEKRGFRLLKKPVRPLQLRSLVDAALR
ncbi:hybrid sensor histidine kinase/response regulator [Saccharospirillum salsuginis]|uniref:histidine kinase n=1 Tax=Saccharospirillum salsuginis TaxID=418750 RepID=A0A918NGE7_9GAMM|nr:PAS domain-containing hybrid sensor histidine kinase/response regulator [Saccharospirillum salsuginis]GGX65564.1 hybrid sensor histidine kinase/response regulator [Saccharospirillum salsuginis]